MLYVNCPLTRPELEETLKQKDEAQRERLVGLPRNGTFSFLGILGAKKKISDRRNKDCNDCDSAEKPTVHPSRTCYVDVKPTTHETSFFLSSS